MILYRDRWVVAVAKPAGIPVHHGASRDGVPMLQRVRDAVGTRVHPVHRLDRPTSGVLLFALDAESTAALQEQLVTTGTKRYAALVRGEPPVRVLVERPVPVMRDRRRRSSRGVSSETPPERRDARTEILGLGVVDDLAADPDGFVRRWGLVEARPHTGRRHQIRRHLKSLSLPIVGDVNYGKGPVNRLFRERHGLHRLALHAAELSLRHPLTGDELTLRAPLPDDLASTLDALGLLEAYRAAFPAAARPSAARPADDPPLS